MKVPKALAGEAGVYLGIGGLILLVAYIVKKRGGLVKGALQTVIGEEGLGQALGEAIAGPELQEQILTPAGAEITTLSGPETTATPGTEKPFVIPIWGEFLNPQNGGEVSRRLFADDYLVDVQIGNATSDPISGVIELHIEEKPILGWYNWKSKIVTSQPIVIQPGQKLRRAIPVEIIHRIALSNLQAKASLRFAGRKLDYIGYDIS